MNCGVNNWCLSKYEEALSIYSPESSPTLFMCFWEFERKQRKIEFRFPVTIEYLCSGGKYFHRSDCLSLRKRSLLYALMWHHFVIAFEWRSSKKAEKYSKLNLRCLSTQCYVSSLFNPDSSPCRNQTFMLLLMFTFNAMTSLFSSLYQIYIFKMYENW